VNDLASNRNAEVRVTRGRKPPWCGWPCWAQKPHCDQSPAVGYTIGLVSLERQALFAEARGRSFGSTVAGSTSCPFTYVRPSRTSMRMGPKRLSQTWRRTPSAVSGRSTCGDDSRRWRTSGCNGAFTAKRFADRAASAIYEGEENGTVKANARDGAPTRAVGQAWVGSAGDRWMDAWRSP
jgi:hypothetical protein